MFLFVRYTMFVTYFIFILINFTNIVAQHGDKQYRCVAQCDFRAPFDDLPSLVLPEKCQTRVQNSVCHIELKVSYETRTIIGIFNEHGDHADMTDDIDLKHGMEMEVREAFYNFQSRKIRSATWINFCTTGDECDKQYLDSHITNILKFEKWSTFEKVSSLIYSNTSNDVNCYLNDTFVTSCENQNVCHYKLSPQSNMGEPYYACHAQPLDGPTIFFQTHQSKSSSSFSSELKKFDVLDYTCNTDKCNNPTMADDIRRLLNKEFEKDMLNSSNSIMFSSKILLMVFLGLLLTLMV